MLTDRHLAVEAVTVLAAEVQQVLHLGCSFCTDSTEFCFLVSVNNVAVCVCACYSLRDAAGSVGTCNPGC